MIKFDILSCWTGSLKFTAEIECDEDAPRSIKLGLALKWAVRNKVSLRGANLSDAYLSDAVLSGANLRGANLSDAVLSDAVLIDANLSGANLRGADLRGAYLRGAYLSGANLSGANLSDAVLSDAVLRGADLSGANLRGADLSGAYLGGANLSGANLSGADLRGADLRGAVLIGAPKIESIHQKVYAAASQPDALDMGDWHHPCGTTHCRAGWVVELAGEEGKALEDRIGTAAAASLIYLASDPTIGRFPSFYCGDDEALADMKRMAEDEAGKG